MQSFTTLTGVAAPLLRPNIDTGTIIASRFMRSRSIDLGEKLFSDWRYAADGSENADFVLNQEPYRHAKILLGGINFGCGSSREAAVYALMKFGISCVIAPSFGEIFFDNACQNGLLPIELPEDVVVSLADAIKRANSAELTVDLLTRRITTPQGDTVGFTIAEDRRTSLLEGLDETALVLRHSDEIDAFRDADRRTRPWLYERSAL